MYRQVYLFHVLPQRAGQVRTAGHVVEVLRLHLLLIRLTVIEVVEVGNDYGHGQRNREHTRYRA